MSLVALALLVAAALLMVFDHHGVGLALLAASQVVNLVAIVRRATRGTVGKWYAPKLPPQ